MIIALNGLGGLKGKARTRTVAGKVRAIHTGGLKTASQPRIFIALNTLLNRRKTVCLVVFSETDSFSFLKEGIRQGDRIQVTLKLLKSRPSEEADGKCRMILAAGSSPKLINSRKVRL